MSAVTSLDELLARSPSEEAFRAILDLLGRLAGAELEAGIARAEAALETWPDETRCAGEQVLVDDLESGAPLRPTAVLLRKLAFEPTHGGCEPRFVVALARSPELSRLTILDLSGEDVECDGAEAIATSPVLQGLKDLRLGQRIGDGGFVAIARSPYLARLERLELAGTISDDDTAHALAASPHLTRLARLDVEFDGEADEMADDALWTLGMSRYIPAAIRRELLSSLDLDTLQGRSEELELPDGADATADTLIAALLDHAGAPP